MESQFGKIHYEIPHFSVLNQNKVDEFLTIKSKWDPMDKFTSLQAKRVGLVLNK